MRSAGTLFYFNLVVLCFVCIVEHFVPWSQLTSEYYLRTPVYMTLMLCLCLSLQIKIFTLWGLYFCLIFCLVFFFLPSTCIPDTKPGLLLRSRNKPKGVSFSQAHRKADISCANLPLM